MEKCKHNFINANDGSLDKICVICGKRAMQGVLYFKEMINSKEIVNAGPLTFEMNNEPTESMIKEINKKLMKNIYFNPQKGAKL